MASFLVIYGTGEGQTAKVAERIGHALTTAGHAATIVDVGALPPGFTLARFDAVLVGASVHDGAHQPEVVAFVRENRESLCALPSAFFQLSITSAMPFHWLRAQAQTFADPLFEKTGWYPDRVGFFAGAVKYSKYDPHTQAIFRRMAFFTTHDTDTSQDYEYTDWEEVERFAAAFAVFAVGAGVDRTLQTP